RADARPERTPPHMARTPETKPEKGSKKKQKLNPDGTPKKGRIKQIVEVYKYTQEVDRSTLPWMIGAIAGAIVLGVLVSALGRDSPWYGIFMGLAIGILIAMRTLAARPSGRPSAGSRDSPALRSRRCSPSAAAGTWTTSRSRSTRAARRCS